MRNFSKWRKPTTKIPPSQCSQHINMLLLSHWLVASLTPATGSALVKLSWYLSKHLSLVFTNLQSLLASLMFPPMLCVSLDSADAWVDYIFDKLMISDCTQASIIDDKGSCWMKINMSFTLSLELSLVLSRRESDSILDLTMIYRLQSQSPSLLYQIIVLRVINWISGGSDYYMLWRI